MNQQILQAARRYNDIQSTKYPAQFYVGDCFGIPLTQFFAKSIQFDVVSCQFSIHYAFSSEERVRTVLQNVSERLRPGGFFIGTTTDSNVIVRKLRATPDLTIQNNVYSLSLHSSFSSKHFPKSESPFGLRYKFTLDNRVESLDEYLIHFPTFIKFAKEYGLELVFQSNFHEFYLTFLKHRKYGELFRKMRVLNEIGTMDLDQWDAIYLYTTFVFKKVGDPNVKQAMRENVQDSHHVNSIVSLTGDEPVELPL